MVRVDIGSDVVHEKNMTVIFLSWIILILSEDHGWRVVRQGTMTKSIMMGLFGIFDLGPMKMIDGVDGIRFMLQNLCNISGPNLWNEGIWPEKFSRDQPKRFNLVSNFILMKL